MNLWYVRSKHRIMIAKLHKEGRNTILVSLLILSVLIAGGFFLHPLLGWTLLLLGVVLSILVFNFFRNPEFPISQDETHVLSPCNGKVVVIEQVQDDIYFHSPVIQVSVFMSPLDVHVNRNPISGTLQLVNYHPGKFLMAFDPKSSSLNEHTYIVAANERVTVAYKQIAGFLARRIRWYVKQGDVVEQGAQYGFIKYGSRIDLLLPIECQVKVELGQVVKAGRTVIATAPGA